jgi:hypothetical protein
VLFSNLSKRFIIEALDIKLAVTTATPGAGIAHRPVGFAIKTAAAPSASSRLVCSAAGARPTGAGATPPNRATASSRTRASPRRCRRLPPSRAPGWSVDPEPAGPAHTESPESLHPKACLQPYSRDPARVVGRGAPSSPLPHRVSGPIEQFCAVPDGSAASAIRGQIGGSRLR